jgi:hypothetical protein
MGVAAEYGSYGGRDPVRIRIHIEVLLFVCVLVFSRIKEFIHVYSVIFRMMMMMILYYDYDCTIIITHMQAMVLYLIFTNSPWEKYPSNLMIPSGSKKSCWYLC